MMRKMKKILASILVVAMVITGLIITPMDSKAADEKVKSTDTGVIFVSDMTKYNFKKLWATKTAPTREGFVFGGWYTNDNADGSGTFTAIKESERNNVATETDVWAKFVPAEVLSIRAQLEKDTETNNGMTESGGTVLKDSTYLRLLSGVNELDYQKVGFEILYNKKVKDPSEENNKTANNITKVFKSITNDETESEPIEAKDIFGEAATHFSVLRLADIKSGNFEKVIYVRPHWTTLDGTTVYGQAKYVRVMDGYVEHHYISVPVNFLTGSDVAAGQIEICYDSTKVKLVADKGFDAGTMMPEMSYTDDESGTIKIIGNVTGEVSGKEDVTPSSAIFANLWFEEVDTLNEGTELNFTIDDEKNSFCNWTEQAIENLAAYDVKYLK